MLSVHVDVSVEGAELRLLLVVTMVTVAVVVTRNHAGRRRRRWWSHARRMRGRGMELLVGLGVHLVPEVLQAVQAVAVQFRGVNHGPGGQGESAKIGKVIN